jgi:LacI family transcriptional regulator
MAAIHIIKPPPEKRPRVILSLGGGPAVRGILDAAQPYHWAFEELRFFGGALPPGPPPQGAIVNLLPTDDVVRRLRELGCPVVRLGRLPHPDDDMMPAVLLDLIARGRMAAEHFEERGFKHVGYVGRNPWSDMQDLYDAFRDRAAELGCACHLLRFESQRPELPRQGPAREQAKYRIRQRRFTDWLATVPKPLGLLAPSDALAGELCSMVTQAGASVPEDVAVLGVGNIVDQCECAPVTLSSIDTDFEGRGREAALLLHRLMDGEPPPSEPIMIPPRGIVVRESTDVLATPDADVARALRFIWDHLADDLSVDRIARHIGISRRTLERAFRRELNRGVNAEVHRKRLERVCELLVTTKLSVVDIAPAVGFKSKDYLHRTFRRSFNVSPRQYRLGRREGEREIPKGGETVGSGVWGVDCDSGPVLK